MAKEIFDVQAALKELTESEVASELARLHGIDRNAYLKSGETDADFLKEFGSKPLPTAAAPQETSSLNEPSTTLNVTGGALAAAAPKVAGMVAKPIKNLAGSVLGTPQVAQTVNPPVEVQRQFVSPEAIEKRVLQSAPQQARPAGPADVVNWAMGKDTGGGQYGRGYLGGASMELEANLHRQVDALEKANPGMKVLPGTQGVLVPKAEYDRIVAQKLFDAKATEEDLFQRAKAASDLRQQRLNTVESLRNPPLSTRDALLRGTGKVLTSPLSNKFMAGYNAMDLLQARNPIEATASGVGLAAPLIAGSKYIPAKYRPAAQAAAAGLKFGAPIANAITRKLFPEQEEQKEQKAAGGAIGYAPGGRVKTGLDAVKKLLGKEVKQNPYKEEFTHGFYHYSPNPNIEAFDPNAPINKITLDNFAKGTRGLTFVTPSPKFGEGFLHSADYDTLMDIKNIKSLKPGTEEYFNYMANVVKPGSTAYPVSVRMGKHYDPTSQESQQILQEYLAGSKNPFPNYLGSVKDLPKYAAKGDWSIIEDPDFLNFLRQKKYDTVKVIEGGVPNIGVFEPQNIRGKFAKYDPTQASSPDFMKAEGGAIEHYANGKSVKAGLDAVKKLFAPSQTKIVRASEALAPHEGKYLLATQSDRMRSTGGDLGGPGFSKFQLEDPRFAEAAWAVGQQPTATAIANVNKRFPEGQAIWTPMIGSETQHHSNKHVYDMLTEEFNRQVAMGNLPPELRARINARLAATKNKQGAAVFPAEIDVANPEQLKALGDTFERRGNISKVLSGEGVGGQKGRIIDYPAIMQEMTDPMVIGSPTHALGTRLFTLTGETAHQPDLHTAFPYVLKGQDLGVAFNPVPKELALQEYIKKFKDFKGREPGYYDLTRSIPSEQITEKYLRSLEAAGHADGGSIEQPYIGYRTGMRQAQPAPQQSFANVQPKDHLGGYLDWVIPYEGATHKVAGDRGGLTNYGITAAGMTPYLGRPATEADVRGVTPETARDIYTKEYYKKLGLQDYDPRTAILAMDAAVNQGPSWTRKALQQTGGDYDKLMQARMARYAQGNPKFKKGWDNRMAQLKDYIDTLPITGEE